MMTIIQKTSLKRKTTFADALTATFEDGKPLEVITLQSKMLGIQSNFMWNDSEVTRYSLEYYVLAKQLTYRRLALPD